MTDVALADIPAPRDLVPHDRSLLPAPMEKLQEVGALIQSAGAWVAPEIRKDLGTCIAVAYMAALHGTDPIMTASKAYLVNGRLAFEAQFVSAIVRQHIDEPFDITFEGDGAQRFATVVGKVNGKALVYSSPRLAHITTRNSPLWKTDPDQQLGAYYSVRAWARRHMPGVLLGIYAVEELQQIVVRDVTPPAPSVFGDDDAEEVEVTFEPSGGFDSSAPPPAEAATVTLKPQHDDPMAFYEECKLDIRETSTKAALIALWESTTADRKRLLDADHQASVELDRLFTARQGELKA